MFWAVTWRLLEVAANVRRVVLVQCMILLSTLFTKGNVDLKLMDNANALQMMALTHQLQPPQHVGSLHSCLERKEHDIVLLSFCFFNRDTPARAIGTRRYATQIDSWRIGRLTVRFNYDPYTLKQIDYYWKNETALATKFDITAESSKTKKSLVADNFTLPDKSGNLKKLSDYKGKYVLLDF